MIAARKMTWGLSRGRGMLPMAALIGLVIVGPHRAQAAPKVTAEVTEHDFGRVWVGETLDFSFELCNGGDEPLEILRVVPSCGCTVAGAHEAAVLPGGCTELPFGLETSNLRSGPQVKYARVYLNDPAAPIVRLDMKFDVRHYVEVDPPSAQFGRVQADSIMTRTIYIVNRSPKPLAPKLDTAQQSKAFKGELREVTAGQKYELTVTASPPFAPGVNREILYVATGIPQQPVIRISCLATLPQRIDVSPDRICLPNKPEEEQKRCVRLLSNGDKPLHVRRATATDERLGVAVEERYPGRLFRLEVTIPAGYEPPPGVTNVLVETDDPSQRLIEIPVGCSRMRAEKLALAGPQRGAPAPNFQTTDVRGQESAIGADVGMSQLVIFYTSWGGGSRQALPIVDALCEEFAERSLRCLAINEDRRTGKMARSSVLSLAHYQELQLELPMVIDDGHEIQEAYHVSEYPTILLIGADGTIQAVHTELSTSREFAATLHAEIEEVLQGKSLATLP